MTSDLTTLSTLLGSQEARNAAPCVPVTGKWVMFRNGSMSRSGKAPEADQDDDWYRAGKAPAHVGGSGYDIIWSGDLPALLSALVAERDRLRELVEAAYREGLHDGYHVVEVPRDEDWERSKVRATLQALKEQQP